MVTTCILSTGNIMTAGAEVIRRPTVGGSNTELVNSLREKFKAASADESAPTENGNGNGNGAGAHRLKVEEWTSVGEDGIMYIPAAANSEPEVLVEDREEYDVTVKLFYLPDSPAASRPQHTQDAIRLVTTALGIPTITLLIISFPHITFDADDDEHSPPADILSWAHTYRSVEALHAAGTIARIGLAEFGTSRLEQFLPHTIVRPSVDQINVRDCCVVPRPLILYAKQNGIELLTHNDCADVLPAETMKGLLEEFGVVGAEKEVRPLWVVKYTAVIRSRGVVENKGYILMTEIDD
ncbi:uncharacterized protein H6S33_008422 [Morchella sextelata]|uniref:uncharacterized protein n=1 Tax=Morchella sextelata TaxID=1174677 RepID=UPI001D039141|nr:uncharacterized protein H6S33_008422 [Morchella sextelata]KAH0602772.1 hypothetical protein H6S33_008422 [Morchella sextelata]